MYCASSSSGERIRVSPGCVKRVEDGSSATAVVASVVEVAGGFAIGARLLAKKKHSTGRACVPITPAARPAGEKEVGNDQR